MSSPPISALPGLRCRRCTGVNNTGPRVPADGYEVGWNLPAAGGVPDGNCNALTASGPGACYGIYGAYDTVTSREWSTQAGSNLGSDLFPSNSPGDQAAMTAVSVYAPRNSR